MAGVAFVMTVRAGEPRSRVVVVRDPATRVPAMVATGLKTLTGSGTEAAAWGQFVASNDVVGLKISTQAGSAHATHRAVVEALVAGLESAGVPRTNIWVFDRDPHKLRAAGYEGTNEVAVIGDTGWDADRFYESRLVGKLIWGDLLFGTEQISTRSHLPKLLTQSITKLINVPVLQDHDVYGLAGCLYNVSLGMVDNTRRFESARLRGDPGIPGICALPAVRGKLVLNVVDALVVGYAGGPEFKPQYSWPAGALYFSRDPVAVDTVAVDLLESKRREQKIPPIGDAAAYVGAATRLGLGQSDRDRIELIAAKP
jgi:uncharacterized protein (DUF362 family)